MTKAKTPKAGVEKIDHRRADDLLLAHEENLNRVVRPAWVRRLRQAIREGQWRLTNDAVAITRDGVVTNGQHRLMAVSEERVPAPGLPLLVLYDVEADDRWTYDTGKPRTACDFFRMRGRTGDAQHVAIAKLMAVGEKTFPDTNAAVAWAVRRWADVAFGHGYISRFKQDARLRGLACAGVGAALARAHASLPAAKTDDVLRFADRLLRGYPFRGQESRRDAPILWLRDKILDDWNRPGVRPRQTDIYWLTQTVLWTWLQGRAFDREVDAVKCSHLFPVRW